MAQTTVGSPAQDEIRNVIVSRLDAMKNKDEGAVKAIVDEHYNKFDDWPPYERQEGSKALENEFDAFKVMSSYTYELRDFQANILGNTAIATFIIHYRAVMRNRTFDVTSRVTSVLNKQDSGWKVVHEHYSRFPDPMQQQQQFMPRRTMQP
ncbi:MAG: nuclear transport factor 2 family protein [Candidatus Bathyarchaeia archaeon]